MVQNLLRQRPRLPWGLLVDYALILLAAILSALNVGLFLAPHRIAPGGVSGLAIIINFFTNWPIGLMMLLMNIPLLALGFRTLGGWRFLRRTLFFVLIANLGVDIVTRYAPPGGISDDLLLNAIYAGVVGGISSGLVYRGGGTVGGTGILSRIIQRLSGTPLSQVYLYTDGIIVLTAALVFGWEAGLYALITLFVWGLASDYVLEGPGVIRTATIITDRGELVAQALIKHLGRGVTAWRGEGKYTHTMHDVLFATINRAQVGELRDVVAAADPNAFVVISQGHQALGYGFRPLRRRLHPPSLEIRMEDQL